MLRVLGVHCANVVRFAVCRVNQCPVCFAHKLCTVPRQCAMCVQQARKALLSMLGVHCANVVCVLLCAGCFSAQAALCTSCVQRPIPVQCLCTHLVGCAMLGVHSENSPHPKCKLLLNAHAHSHPPTSCAQCVLCTLCALYPPAMGPAVAPRSRRSPAKCVVIV